VARDLRSWEMHSDRSRFNEEEMRTEVRDQRSAVTSDL